MKIKNLLISIAVLTAALCGHSCVKVDELSDVNSIKSIAITAHYPERIELGEAVLHDDQSTIVIPVKYGAESFPLTVHLKAQYSGEIDKVVGVDFLEGVTLDTPDNKVDFYVMALSGLSRKYTIMCEMVNYEIPEDIPFSIISQSPEDVALLGRVRVKEEGVSFFVVEPEWPVKVIPQFLPDTLEFEGFENGKTEFSFENADSRVPMTIVNKKTGAKRDFQARMTALEEVTGVADLYEATNIYNSDFSAQLKEGSTFDFEGFRIENDADSLTLYLKRKDGAAFPVELNVDFGLLDLDAGLIGIGNKDAITLEDFDTPVRFWLVDVENQIARHWKITAHEVEEQGEADVLNFSFGSYEAPQVTYSFIPMKKGPAIVLDTENVDIIPHKGEIWLRATEINNSLLDLTEAQRWRLTVKDVVIAVSDGATYELPTLYWERNDSWKTPISFEVAPSVGEPKIWTVNIRDVRGGYTPSAERDINDIRIASLLPYMAKVDPLEPVSLDPENKIITVKLTEDDGCYPLSVKFDYDLSPFAVVTSQNNNTEPLVFGSREAVNVVTVKAEDGTADDWTVKLIPPVSTQGANVTSFRINSFSSSVFKAVNAEIDAEAAEIVVKLDRAGSCPMAMNYSMKLSRRATAKYADGQPFPEEGSISFGWLSDVIRFTVEVPGGQSKEWTLRIADHNPQLINYTLDSWVNDKAINPTGTKDSPYWATANNAFVTGTTRTEGNGGGSAARLYTQTAMGKLASGSLLLGWFDGANPIPGLTDPVKLVFQGIEFSAFKKVVAIEIDVNYHSGGAGNDTGSIAVEFLKHDPSKGAFVYHGRRPASTDYPEGEIHPENTAVPIGRRQAIVGNKADSEGYVTNVVPDQQWTTLRLDLDYGTSDPLNYTHLTVICASSSKGHSFIGDNGTTMLIDNVKLIYEE